MLGGVINTFATLAFAETTFGLLRVEKRIGPVAEMNRRSVLNRAALNEWMTSNPLFELGVANPENRGAAVTHPNGVHEAGIDVARYVNAFPGTSGDYRAWIGGIRPVEDITALLDNLKYAYHRARIVVLEEERARLGVTFPAPASHGTAARKDDPNRAYRVLVCDLVGLKFDAKGKPDHSAVKAHAEAQGAVWHDAPLTDEKKLEKGRIHFFYQPHLSATAELVSIAAKGRYNAVIAAATVLPKECVFKLGGVRIGAGTGNMASASWGGGNGEGGEAPLMNTPSFNSRATAHMVFKALLKVMPDLPVDELHRRTVAGEFDTGRHLKDFPAEKPDGRKMAIIGYGNIGREVAKLAQAFGMRISIHARPRHEAWIESEGFEFAASPEDAARGADVISPHTGLGPLNAATGKYATAQVVNGVVFDAMNDGAILINYDRGECVDAAALDAAMAVGKVRHAAIDADIFVNPETAAVSGPMAPYLELARKYPGRLELLPHAAADTGHVSRFDGAKQAVDQIIAAIRFRAVTNLKGDLPEGYTRAGSRTVAGVGKCTAATLKRVADDATDQLRTEAETMAAIWGALASAQTAERRDELIARHGAGLVMSFNTYATQMRQLGLEGPYA